jgi:DNA-directed RNA polymerase specialized sigma24 family protein
MSRTTVPDPIEATDDDLYQRVGAGDRLAFGELYLRHHESAWGMANAASGFSADAEVAVIEGVATAWASIPSHHDGVRPHLLAAVRRAALDRQARTRRVDPWDTPGYGTAVDANPVRRFLRLLPEEWRSALWLTQVEDLEAGEVGRIIGLEPASVTIVASLAWEAVSGGCLDSHRRAEARTGCRPTVDRIDPYRRGEMAGPERMEFEAHCEDCATCSLHLAELDPLLGLLGAVPSNPLLGAEAQVAWLTLLDRPRAAPSRGRRRSTTRPGGRRHLRAA